MRYLCVIASKTALRGALVALNTGHKSGISGLEDVHKDLHRSALLHRVPLLGHAGGGLGLADALGVDGLRLCAVPCPVQAPAQEPPHAAGDSMQDDETEARRAAILAKIKGL